MIVELRGKTVNASRRDIVIAHIVFISRSTFDLDKSGQRSNIRENDIFFVSHAIAAYVS